MAEEQALAKFVPFVKVDEAQRLVSGIVTAERPDQDHEICDYEKTKPYYQNWSASFQKSTDGISFGNLRAMHQLEAVGKAVEPIEFRDEEKEIVMTFKVIDDSAWQKVVERVYTGFSQGGRKVEQYPDPTNKRYQRYVANPSEVSLVDNPCLPEARFAYVKADGSVEMRKFLKTEAPPEIVTDTRVAALEAEVALLKAAAAPATAGVTAAIPAAPAPVTAAAVPNTNTITTVEKAAKTKRVAGKDLPASDFAYVGDPDKTETWKFPIHDKAHARNALARFNQAKGIPAGEKGKVRSKIVAAARKFGIDVASDNEKAKAVFTTMRKAVRIYVNQHPGIVSKNLLGLDAQLGKAQKVFHLAEENSLAKGLWEVSRLACLLDDLSCMVWSVCCEQEWELDEDSALPHMLAENVTTLTETFVAMVDEETREMLEAVNHRVAH